MIVALFRLSRGRQWLIHDRPSSFNPKVYALVLLMTLSLNTSRHAQWSFHLWHLVRSLLVFQSMLTTRYKVHNYSTRKTISNIDELLLVHMYIVQYKKQLVFHTSLLTRLLSLFPVDGVRWEGILS